MILAKRFSTWCRHFCISRSWSRDAPKPVSVERPVPDDGPEPEILEKGGHPRKVVRPAGKDHEPHEAAERVHDRHDLARQAAPATSDPLPFGPPFAPDAV